MWARRAGLGAAVLVMALLGGCSSSEGGEATPGSDARPDADLPSACALPPTTVEAARVGSSPAGGAAFEVADAVALPTPIVPNPDGALSQAEMRSRADTTDLFSYSLVFSDEAIADESIQLDLYDDVPEGETRGTVTILPKTSEPLAAGDVVADGTTEGLSVPFPLLSVDLRVSTDDTNSYLGSPTGQVEVLALTARTLCLDVDLTWALNDPDGNTLTIKGVLAGRILPASGLVTLG